MNLDDAELLSMLQRNIEICRTTADTAEMLLRQYMERFTKNYYHRGAASPAHAGEAAPPSLPLVKKQRKKKPPKTFFEPPKKAKKKTGPGSKTPLSRERLILGDYLEGHTGPFRSDDLLDWAGKKGVAYDKSKLMSVLYYMANQRKALVSNGQGEYQKQ
jgi:hypothetical protein